MGNPIDIEKVQEEKAYKLHDPTKYEKFKKLPKLKSRSFNILLLFYIFVSLLLLTISSVSKPMKWAFILEFDFSNARFIESKVNYEDKSYVYLIPTNDTSSDSYSRESLNIYGVYQVGLWNWLKWDVSKDGDINNFTVGPQKSTSDALNLVEVINNDVMKVNSSIKIVLPNLEAYLGSGSYWQIDSSMDMKTSYNANKVIQPFFVLSLLFFSVTLGLTIQNYIKGNSKVLRQVSAGVSFLFILITTVFYSLASPQYRHLISKSFQYISVSYSKTAAGLFYSTFAIYLLITIKMVFWG
ncbi:hypothetical protein CLIB1423_12S03224 [[Candida] railenensis]|uniref:Uncharacterized protein n=1 Tax=[Candida] railenensis TaxID=45579 RepID=A0A9P0VYI7_9ASCO|nr:hypothetical protein CLIB1423_12S03224 [[Candida] railenensis]